MCAENLAARRALFACTRHAAQSLRANGGSSASERAYARPVTDTFSRMCGFTSLATVVLVAVALGACSDETNDAGAGQSSAADAGPTSGGAGGSMPDPGGGIAARYPRVVGIEDDPDVIFADDFESYAQPSELGPTARASATAASRSGSTAARSPTSATSASATSTA